MWGADLSPRPSNSAAVLRIGLYDATARLPARDEPMTGFCLAATSSTISPQPRDTALWCVLWLFCLRLRARLPLPRARVGCIHGNTTQPACRTLTRTELAEPERYPGILEPAPSFQLAALELRVVSRRGTRSGVHNVGFNWYVWFCFWLRQHPHMHTCTPPTTKSTRPLACKHQTNKHPPLPRAAKQTESSSMPSTRSRRSPRRGPPGRRRPTACASMASTSRPWKATSTA